MGDCQDVLVTAPLPLRCRHPNPGFQRGPGRKTNLLSLTCLPCLTCCSKQVRLAAAEVIHVCVDDLEFNVEDFAPVSRPTHIRMCKHVHVFTCMCRCTHEHTSMCVRTHTHIHTLTELAIQPHAPLCFQYLSPHTHRASYTHTASYPATCPSLFPVSVPTHSHS